MRTITTSIIISAILINIVGCGADSHVKNLEDKNFQLIQANQQLEKQVEESKTKSKELQKQIEVLSELDGKTRIDSLYDLQTVKLTRYTNFYDKDKDGSKEKLIVYIQPTDSQGDIIKASGSVEVELWDLNRPGNEAMLAKWQVQPDELKKMWYATVVTSNYRLVFDVAEIIKSLDGPFTVKVNFTDYVSGRVFIEQRMVKL